MIDSQNRNVFVPCDDRHEFTRKRQAERMTGAPKPVSNPQASVIDDRKVFVPTGTAPAYYWPRREVPIGGDPRTPWTRSACLSRTGSSGLGLAPEDAVRWCAGWRPGLAAFGAGRL
jgi:hypothetical protein